MRKIVLLLSLITMVMACTQGVDIKLAEGQEEFTVSLKANPSTGYSWNVQSYDKNFLKLKKNYYEKQVVDNRVGASSMHVFVFSVIKKPKTRQEIIFVYGRPWEKNPVKVAVYWVGA